jgi:glycosyltransferase involved in cell wall biosynthesis
MKPSVSVIIPTHNRPAMLAEALASVRAQTFKDYEIIVVSNGENDNARKASREVVANHHCRYAAHYVRYFELRDGNVSAARNFGIANANGEWIAFLDDDDLWLPTKLERQVAEAERTGADMIACDFVMFFPDGRESIVRSRLPDGWSYIKAIGHDAWGAAPSATMVRKTAFKETGGFDLNQRYGEDYDLWWRISWRHTIHQIDEVLMRYRRGYRSTARCPMFYHLRRYAKMRRNTPRHLRSALPSPTRLIVPTLTVFGPEILGHLLRTRWILFRERLLRF